MKRSARSSKKSQRGYADRLFSRIIRSVGLCEAATWEASGVVCNGTLQCAHIIGRANYRLRWDLQNALSLCAGHHIYYTHHPLEWYEEIRARYPERYEYLLVEGRKMWDKDYVTLMATLETEALERGL